MEPDCAGPAEIERVNAMRRRAAAEGIPLHATLELTRRCSIRCIHCYVLPNAAPPETELSTADWLGLAQEASAAGCYAMLLTGGEPLVRADFPEIYLGVRQLGILLTLFTNATRVDERVIEVLHAAPPRVIEVTVYGASPETYARVTGRGEFYHQAMRGIAMLREARLPVRLKTVLMRENRHDFEAMRALSAPDERPLRYDPVIQPRFAGDPACSFLRVPPAEVAELEFRQIPGIAEQWRKLETRFQQPDPAAKTRLYTCAAGSTSFYVTAQGMVQPCVSAIRFGVRYERGRLLEAFRTTRAALRAVPVPPRYECATCGDRVFCASCPPVAELECGDEGGKCTYACLLARERRRHMTAHDSA